MNGLLGAVAFLTRVPVGGAIRPIGIPWFPLVGFGVGAAGGAVYWLLAGAVPTWVAAVGAVATTILLTGAFHEDGLADTFDGLASFRTVERQLEIMKDSRLGTFGATALVLVLLGRVGLVSTIEPSSSAVLVLGWSHAVAAAVVIALMTVSRPVSDGSGADAVAGVARLPALVAAGGTVIGGWLMFGGDAPVAAWAASVAALAIWWWARRRIGGVTGDVLGACQQVGLLAALAVLA